MFRFAVIRLFQSLIVLLLISFGVSFGSDCTMMSTGSPGIHPISP